MNKDREEYENHMKNIVEKFSSMCNMEKLYFAWVNDYLSKTDDRVSFWSCNPNILIDLTLSGEFEKKGVKERFKENQLEALDWLRKNTLTFTEFLNKKENGELGKNSD